jgi:hypothetical protein
MKALIFFRLERLRNSENHSVSTRDPAEIPTGCIMDAIWYSRCDANIKRHAFMEHMVHHVTINTH